MVSTGRPVCSEEGAGCHLGLGSQKVTFGGNIGFRQIAKELNRPRHQGGVQQNVTDTKGYMAGVMAYSSGEIV